MELSLATDMKHNKKGFYRFVGQERQAKKENIPPVKEGRKEELCEARQPEPPPLYMRSRGDPPGSSVKAHLI